MFTEGPADRGVCVCVCMCMCVEKIIRFRKVESKYYFVFIRRSVNFTLFVLVGTYRVMSH